VLARETVDGPTAGDLISKARWHVVVAVVLCPPPILAAAVPRTGSSLPGSATRSSGRSGSAVGSARWRGQASEGAAAVILILAAGPTGYETVVGIEGDAWIQV
jgi:hypothetical protein